MKLQTSGALASKARIGLAAIVELEERGIYTPQTYQLGWQLNTIPDVVFKSENGRRTRPAKPRQVIKDCLDCGEPLNATQRRKPCPKCGSRANDDRKRNCEHCKGTGLIAGQQCGWCVRKR